MAVLCSTASLSTLQYSTLLFVILCSLPSAEGSAGGGGCSGQHKGGGGQGLDGQVEKCFERIHGGEGPGCPGVPGGSHHSARPFRRCGHFLVLSYYTQSLHDTVALCSPNSTTKALAARHSLLPCPCMGCTSTEYEQPWLAAHLSFPVCLRVAGRTGDPALSMPWSHAGAPTITVPCALVPHADSECPCDVTDVTLPVGITFVGRHGSDEGLLDVAALSENFIKPI